MRRPGCQLPGLLLTAGAAVFLTTSSPAQCPEGTPNGNEMLARFRKYAPIIWLASDERIYPMMPHPFAFDDIDNDEDGLKDLQDPTEILMDVGKRDDIIRLVDNLREFSFTTDLSLVEKEPLPQEIVEKERVLPKVDVRQYARKMYGLRKGEIERPVLEVGRLSQGIRDCFELMGIDLPRFTVVTQKAGDPRVQRYDIHAHLMLGAIDRSFLDVLRDGRIDAALCDRLKAVGVSDPPCRGTVRTDTTLCPGETIYVLESAHPEIPRYSVRYYLLPTEEALEVYADGKLVFEASKNPENQTLRIRHRSKLPSPRVTYHLHETKLLAMDVYEYWLYYLYDIGTNPHLHDGEHVFVFVDAIGNVVAVVGSGHTDASANNILVSSNKLETNRVLPQTLPKHMPILVELGKHASAPDRSFDSRFDLGMDANMFYRDVWGSRDISAAVGVDQLRRASAEFSFPKDRSTLIVPRDWKDLLERRRPDDEEMDALTPTDRAIAKAYGTADADESKFGPNRDVYTLFPLAKMQHLIEVILADPTSTREQVRSWLMDNIHCFWPDTVRTFEITQDGFEAMRAWAQDTESNRDLWLHRDFKKPDDVFKLWLFPRTALGFGALFGSRGAIGRIAISRADFLGLMPNSMAELFVDVDIETSGRAFEFRNVGLNCRLFRGSHQGWFAGGGRGGGAGRGQTFLNLGYVPLSWDLMSIPLVPEWMGHAQVSILTAVRAEIHKRSGTWFVDPLGLQAGLMIGRSLQGPVHPLRY